MLASRPRLVKVKLWYTPVDVRLLAQCAGLQELEWRDGGDPDGVIELVERLPSLRELTIGGCDMELSHVQRLGRALQSSDVTVLTFHEDLSDEAREAIGQLVTSKLTKLSFSPFGVQGCESLLQGLQSCMPPVEVLGLNYVGMQQEQAVALASWLRQIKCLRYLDVSLNRIGDAGASAICEALLLQDGLENMVLSSVGMSRYPDALLQLVRRSKTLRLLWLADYVSIDDENKLLNALAVNMSLRELRLWNVSGTFAERLFARNGWITKCYLNNGNCLQYTDRNKAAHAMARTAVDACVMCMGRMGIWKELRRMIGRMVWETRGQVGLWEAADKRMKSE